VDTRSSSAVAWQTAAGTAGTGRDGRDGTAGTGRPATPQTAALAALIISRRGSTLLFVRRTPACHSVGSGGRRDKLYSLRCVHWGLRSLMEYGKVNKIKFETAAVGH